MGESFISKILAPGGGVALIPFIRYVISFLVLICGTAFVCDVARIHMAVLIFLSVGLLISLQFFEKEFARISGRPSSGGSASISNSDKTD